MRTRLMTILEMVGRRVLFVLSYRKSFVVSGRTSEGAGKDYLYNVSDERGTRMCFPASEFNLAVSISLELAHLIGSAPF